MAARDPVDVGPGYDVEFTFLERYPRHRQCDRGVQVTDDEVDSITIDELSGFRDPRSDVVFGVLDQQLRWAAENAAPLIDLIERETRAARLGLGELRINTAQRLNHSYFHRLFAADLNQAKPRAPCARRGAIPRPSAPQCVCAALMSDVIRSRALRAAIRAHAFEQPRPRRPRRALPDCFRFAFESDRWSDRCRWKVCATFGLCLRLERRVVTSTPPDRPQPPPPAAPCVLRPEGLAFGRGG